MRLATFLAPDSSHARAGEVRGEQVVAYADERFTLLDRLRDPGAPAADGPSFALSDVTLLAPVPEPRAIFGIGLNYADHIAETGGTAPETPLVFTKLPASIVAPGASVTCPAVVKRLDYEGELAVVMGADGQVGATPSPTTSLPATCRGARRSGRVPRVLTASAPTAPGSLQPMRFSTHTRFGCVPGSTASCARNPPPLT